MSEQNLYTIFDRVAEESGPVFEAKNDAVALRKFRDFMKQNPIDPREFRLIALGRIDHATNKLTVLATPIDLDVMDAQAGGDVFKNAPQSLEEARKAFGGEK